MSSSEMFDIDIKTVSFLEYRDEIVELRERVWHDTDFTHGQQIFSNGFLDKNDFTAFHWAIFGINNKIIAAARLSMHDDLLSIPDTFLIKDSTQLKELDIKLPIGSLNRLVVDLNFQGKGISKILDKIRIEKAKELGCQSVCVMTYGKRGKKLLHDGFNGHALLKYSDDFRTDKISSKAIPPSFYYKEF